MESIQVTTESLRGKAGEVREKAEEYSTRYQSFLSDVGELTTSDWKGDDANAFREQVEGFREDFERMKGLMDEYAQFLEDAARRYEDTQTNVSNTIKSLQN